jgi:S1-C subfamily serine protease
MRVSQKLSLLVCALFLALVSCTSCAHQRGIVESIPSVTSYTQQVYPLVKASIGLFMSSPKGMKVVGTGVIIECTKGAPVKVITANHVAEGIQDEGSPIFGGTLSQKSYIQFKVLRTAEKHDLALLVSEAPAEDDCVVAPVATGFPSVGSFVWVVGYPMGVERNVSHGILSATYFSNMKPGTFLYRIDAAVAPGNSGGGVFNQQGELIGIVSFMQLMKLPLPGFPILGSASPVAGGGHAISVVHIRDLLRDTSPPASNPSRGD